MNILIKCNFHDDKAVFDMLKSNLWPEGSVCSHFSKRQFRGYWEGEYGHRLMHASSIESYLSKFKRGMERTYQHRSKKHFIGHSAEFDSRCNRRQVTEEKPSDNLLAGIVGKRIISRHLISAVH